MSDRPCLEEEDLLPLAGGEPAAPEVQQHLDRCETCRERLKQLAGEVASLRRARQESAYFPPAGGADPAAGAGESWLMLPKSRSTARPAAIGKYFIAGLLDEMETTYTYRALHPTFNKELVIKLGRRKSEVSPGEQKALLEEGKRLAQLDHPGLVKVYDLDFFKNRPFLVMEHIPGITLKRFREENPVPPAQAAALVAKIARGLAEIHRRGLVHQEVHPGNVQLTEAGEPRLAFGLASLRQRQPDEPTQPISLRLHFMAPEQARGEKERLSPRSDIFSMGCVLYFLLTGKLPFEGTDPFDSLNRVRRVEVDFGALRVAKVPARLEAICARALEADPAQRFASADEMADRLERFFRHPHGLTPLLLLIGGAVIAGGAVAAYFLLR